MVFQRDRVQKMLGTGNEKDSLIKTFYHEILEHGKRKFLNGV